ncbi:hypothetical protein [Nannocystis radixulma]|uniref:Copper resistance protein D domain-containing protein n=1 Tax=Nannocystis radixulma TaxID=2995305 RepID=A0ABT5BJ74_9BACT|nr:hypothetical protein [Nannocystis radixulma]MDC0674201.1 hypothetical protein [Nannocystis radixulma]
MSTAIAGAVPIAVHVLGGGVWIGAMVFSVFILHPRAERFFTRATEFEDFIFSVVHGARYKVLAGIAAIVASGVALALAYRDTAAPWSWLVAVKVALLLISLALFLHVSFTLWPRRVFAREDELPAVRRRFWWIGVVMIVCNTANMGLGVLARVLRG